MCIINCTTSKRCTGCTVLDYWFFKWLNLRNFSSAGKKTARFLLAGACQSYVPYVRCVGWKPRFRPTITTSHSFIHSLHALVNKNRRRPVSVAVVCTAAGACTINLRRDWLTVLLVCRYTGRLKTRERKTRHGQKRSLGVKRGTRMHAFLLTFNNNNNNNNKTTYKAP